MGNKKVPFCCPTHGNLQGEVQYASIVFSTKKIKDLPYKYCDRCDVCYTPFGNIVSLFRNIRIKGKKLLVGRMSKEGKILVERPKIVSLENNNSDNKKDVINDKKTLTTRNAFIRNIILTNKPKFIKEHLCPKCLRKLKKEYVGIRMFDKGGYVCSNIYSCEICNQDYVSPEMLGKIYDKADNKFNDSSGYYFPDNIHIFWDNANYCFYTPYYYKDTENYDIHNLPPQHTTYYDLSNDEYNCFIDFYVKYHFKDFQEKNYEYVEFDGILNDKSVLKKHGYSIQLLTYDRRIILKKCVSLYGIDKVLQILRFNINMRQSQENGENKFATALSVWKKDIEYIEETYDTL